ncbi:class I fructose-bisphosphate aldolase [Agrococcus jejuensis]|uniref:class I fructose-bisphosphate aldolase n=1 Tax=Agrococcus jejuensis TaxID=399736 RepID=UPI0011AA258D|nr:fructose-bisphosphate aldolase [Agrococcus jejuensis]
MHGTDIRLARLFDDESGRSLITAYDHGQSFPLGARSGSPRRTLEQIVAGRPEGVLLTPGMLAQHADLFARRGAPSVVLRADWTLLDEPDKHELGERYRVLVDPAEAVALGADAIVMYLIARPTDGGMFADNVAAVATAAQQASRAGIPLIVETTLWGLRNEDRKDPERLATVSRIAAEIGAHAIKTEYVGDPEVQRGIVETVGDVPVLTLGGARGDDDAVIAAAQGAIDGGASGLIFGRNIWMADDVVGTTRRLSDVTHGRTR